MAALKALAPDRVAGALVKPLKSKNEALKIWAACRARELPASQGEKIVPALIERVADEDWPTKEYVYKGGWTSSGSKDEALAALKTLAPDRVAGALLKARKSKNDGVRKWATTELGKLKKD
ncbi:MAG TPA: hypothetical protein VH682_23405 [Gemmataceae bacterium]